MNKIYMQKQFVTYEIALKLKELGFNEPCFGYYTPIKSWMIQGTKINPEPHFHGPNWSNVDNTFYFMYKSNSFGDRTEVVYNSYFTKAIYNIAVPLWQQAIDWFNEKHHIHIQINSVNWRQGKQFEAYLCRVLTQEDIDKGNYSKYLYLSDLYVTSEEARRDGILEVLEMIKK